MISHFEKYAAMAKTLVSPTLVNGRLRIQQYSEPFILSDVVSKLKLTKDDVLLDIGCGMGLLCMPLTQICKQVYALDNAEVITRLKRGYVPSNCSLWEGAWLGCTQVFPHVNKILCYSVLHYLRDLAEVFSFVDKMLPLLPEDGMILLGDIPNVDKKRRFLSSRAGTLFDEKFKRELSTSEGFEEEGEGALAAQKTETAVTFDDESLMDILQRYRKQGHDAYILPQPEFLPFGRSREDIMIVKRSD